MALPRTKQRWAKPRLWFILVQVRWAQWTCGCEPVIAAHGLVADPCSLIPEASDVLLECCSVGVISHVKLSQSSAASRHRPRRHTMTVIICVAQNGSRTRGRVGMWQACVQITVVTWPGRAAAIDGQPGQGTSYWLWLGQALRLSCPGTGTPGRRRKLTWPIEEAHGGTGEDFIR